MLRSVGLLALAASPAFAGVIQVGDVAAEEGMGPWNTPTTPCSSTETPTQTPTPPSTSPCTTPTTSPVVTPTVTPTTIPVTTKTITIVTTTCPGKP